MSEQPERPPSAPRLRRARQVAAGLLLLLAFTAAGAIYAVRPRVAAGEDERPPQFLEIETEVVELRPVPNTEVLSGFANPHRTVELALEESGRVVAKPHEEGEFVTEGELLVQLDTSLVEAELAQAEAALSEAQRTLELERERLTRAEALREEQAISQDEFDTRVAAFQVASALHERALAARDMAAVRLARHRLVAPLSGVLSVLDVEIGSMTTPGVVIGRLDDVSVLEVDLSVAPEVRRALALGDPVAVWPDYEPTAVKEGVISRLAEVAGAVTRKFEVEVRLDNADGALLGGTPVRCRLTLGPPRLALLLDQEWSINRGAVQGVYRVISGSGDLAPKVVFTPLQTRPVRGAPGLLEVLEGLTAGDVVATERLSELRDGMEILPVRGAGGAGPVSIATAEAR